MIWYVGLLVCTVLAFLLALRSMRDFQDNPETKSTDYGLFLIKNTAALTNEVFIKLVDSLKGYISAIELIQKGESKALVVYVPHFVLAQFPLLEMVEIEDYILGRGQVQEDPFILSRQINLDDSFSWKLQAKKTQPNILKKTDFNIDLASDQYLAWQIVFDLSGEKLQITPRVIIKDKDPQQKIGLIKKVKQQIDEKTSLMSGSSLIHSGVYEDYKKRTIVPKHVQQFLVSPESVRDFLS
jgi:hypothetical protein